MFDEFRNPSLVIELVRTLRLLALVLDGDANTLIEEGLFPQTLRELVEAKCRLSKDLRIGQEGDLGTAFSRLSCLFQRYDWNPAHVFLFIGLPVAPNLQM